MSLDNKDECSRFARQTIQGLRLSLSKSCSKSFGPPPSRQGTSIVERCARAVELPCNGCQRSDCLRCTIAAELRAAEERIHAERDAEIAELPLTSADLETLVDKIVGNLCVEHATFGSALTEQWYNRRSFLDATTDAVSALEA
jgi:hypothetical protein